MTPSWLLSQWQELAPPIKILTLLVVGVVVLSLPAIIYASVVNAHEKHFLKSSSGQPLHWLPVSLPITALFDTDFPTEYSVAYKIVALETNAVVRRQVLDRIGCTWLMDPVILHSNDVPKHHVYITAGAVNTTFGQTTLHHHPAGNIDACFIDIPQGLRENALLTAVRHELGHCLGLQHSNDVNSPMYPTIRHNDAHLSKPFTSADIQHLRWAYDKK